MIPGDENTTEAFRRMIAERLGRDVDDDLTDKVLSVGRDMMNGDTSSLEDFLNTMEKVAGEMSHDLVAVGPYMKALDALETKLVGMIAAASAEQKIPIFLLRPAIEGVLHYLDRGRCAKEYAQYVREMKKKNNNGTEAN